jgi:RHS repeat-associated protein
VDVWGYQMEGRKFASSLSQYKFTSKERDIESDYDYFGARYYDSRIARWGGMEPKYDKYVSLSPYNYGLLNPLKLVDVNGLEVTYFNADAGDGAKVSGELKQNIENALNTTGSNLTFSISDGGRLSYTGTAVTDEEIYFAQAIDDPSTKVNLYFTEGHAVGGTPFGVGLYYGSQIGENGNVETAQFLNMHGAEAFEEVGGGSIGNTIRFETMESYKGAEEFQGTHGIGPNAEDHSKLHKKTLDIGGNKDAEIEEHYKLTDNKNVYSVYLVNKKTGKHSKDFY